MFSKHPKPWCKSTKYKALDIFYRTRSWTLFMGKCCVVNFFIYFGVAILVVLDFNLPLLIELFGLLLKSAFVFFSLCIFGFRWHHIYHVLQVFNKAFISYNKVFSVFRDRKKALKTTVFLAFLIQTVVKFETFNLVFLKVLRNIL